MREYLLFLPIIFIFHDMEEIIGFGWFFKKNPWLYERFPKVMKPYIGWTHEGFAAAVYEEFIPFFGISLLAYYFPWPAAKKTSLKSLFSSSTSSLVYV